ncbi:MAG: response regulator [Planctomycetota bacterium]
MEIKWDLKRGAEIYRSVYDIRLKKWVATGKIKRGEALVWRSGFSGMRKAEDLEELAPFFNQWERKQLRRTKKPGLPGKPLLQKDQIKNILIIDDEKDLCSLLSDVLTRKGYNVSVAHSKREGVTFLKKELPDLVFLDLKLPDDDGMKILSKINNMDSRPIVSIISAYGSEEKREEAKKKGVYSFIDKPFTEKDILRNIRSCIRK